MSLSNIKENNIEFGDSNVEPTIVGKSIETDKIIKLKNDIEILNKFHQIEILKIFNNFNSNMINENNNGIFINLLELPIDLYEKLNDYILYVNIQQKQINCIEKEKITIENKFFKEKNKFFKENKDTFINNISVNAEN